MAAQPKRASGSRVRVPQQARSRRTRDRILEAAVACFEERGYDETPITAIAKRAKISVGSFYTYFEEKQSILLELVDRTVNRIAKHVIANVDPEAWQGRDPREILRSLIDAVFHMQRLNPGMQRIMLERYFKDEALRAPVEEIRAQIREAVEKYLEALAAEGQLRAVDPHSAAYVITNAVQWNAIHAYVEGEDLDRAAATTARMVERFLFSD